ncbi:MAG: hypothetical protein R2813_07730 [Flavobacteriales bacterium]
MKYTLLIILSFFASTVFAQELDLKQHTIELISGLSHMSGEKVSIVPSPNEDNKDEHGKRPTDIHEVIIDTKEKRIKIIYQKTEEVRYDVGYTSAYQGDKSQSVKLNPTETMFMVKDEHVNMITHDSQTKTMHVILKDSQIELFGHLQFKEG